MDSYVNDAELREAMRRIEHKLDALIAALAQDEEEPPARSLDNGRTFAARDTSRGLG